DRLILEYDNPVPEDKEYALRAAQAAPWSLTVNEWRELSGHGALTDANGNVFPVPYNLYFTQNFGYMQQDNKKEDSEMNKDANKEQERKEGEE
ncbi:MAG TPA: hypothetical protein PKV93_14780, partial [Fervidobacterium sp.]|nr:hypothetical protein [Fervidobacterium sp.]